MRNSIRFWLPVVVWMAVIFVFSSKGKVAFSDSYTISFIFFKSLHLIEYALLYILTFRALRNTGLSHRAPLYAFIITFIYGLTDEFHQHFVPTREGKLRDGIIDGFGGIIGWVICVKLLPKTPKKLRTAAKRWQLF